MHHIIFETPLNQSFLMIDAMREALNRSKALLPYGMDLTMIFRDPRVSFEGEMFVDCHTSTLITTTSFDAWGLLELMAVGPRAVQLQLRRRMMRRRSMLRGRVHLLLCPD